MESEPRRAAPWRATLTLCCCMLVHSYLLISVFPYSGYMAMDLLDLSREEAGSYAGWLAASFMLGRALTSVPWGWVADSHGRRTVLVISLALSAVGSLAFGLSPTFAAAMSFRFLLGASNGIMGSIKVLVSELATTEEGEAKTMSLVIGMWGWGFLISPAIAGFLADPVDQYSGYFDDEHSSITRILTRYPYLLPNILGSLLCLMAAAAALCFVEETLPPEQMQPWSDLIPFRKLLQRLRNCHRVAVLRKQSSREQLEQEDVEAQSQQSEESSCEEHVRSPSVLRILQRRATRISLGVYWTFSFVGLTVDEAVPLFLLSEVAGFGLAERTIGSLLSVAGLVFAIAQYFVATAFYNRFGLIRSIRMGALLSALILFLVPWSVWMEDGSSLEPGTFVYLALCFAFYRSMTLVVFSNISVAVNRSVPSEERATTNGLSALGGSVMKGLGPAFAGYLVTYSVRWCGEYGSLLIFGIIALLGVAVFVASLQMEELPEKEGSTRSAGSSSGVPATDGDEEEEEEERSLDL